MWRSILGVTWRCGRCLLARVRDAFAIVGVMAVVGVLVLPADQRAWALRRAVVLLDRHLTSWIADAEPPLDGATPIVWPVAEHARVSSGFGARVHPILGVRKAHNGVDLAVPVGTSVRSAAAGTVKVVGSDDLNGNYVVVTHPSHLRTAYCHLDEAVVTQGMAVSAGDLLGRSGATGRATGPHLHFGTWWHGRPVDPRRLPRAN